MNILFIFPPQWLPVEPHFAIPSLMGQFRGSRHNVEGMDLNLEFYLKILNKDHLEKCIKNAREIKEKLAPEIKEKYKKSIKYEDYPLEDRNKFLKYILIRDFLEKNEKELHKFPYLISQAIEIMRSKELFYNPRLFIDSLDIIDKCLRIASLEYAPSTMSMSSFYNQNFRYNYENIDYFVNDKSTNMFYDFMAEKLEEIKAKKPDYIGISINSSSQIVAGLTLSKLLKENTNANITIGGNYFGRVTEAFSKHKEFFEVYADYLLVEEGEKPVLELAEFFNGERKLEEVSNLMYLKDGEVKINNKTIPMPLNEMKPMSFNGYDLKKYLAPEIILPFQTSRGCYWHKCSFCDHDFGMHYNVKSLDKLVDEIKTMKREYDIDKFEFIDEAISPNYMNNMAQRLLDEGIKISYFCDGRLEEGFTYEILKKAHDSGLKMVLWGLESGSRKIMDLINKGVDFDKRIDVFKNAAKAGVFNFAFIFFGFPAETKADAMMTIKLIHDNKDVIHTYGRSIFTMGKHTLIRENPEKYGVDGEIKQEDEFSPTYIYKAKGMTPEELNEVIGYCNNMANNTYGNNLVFKLVSREIIFLYLIKYGLEDVINYRF
ncbi:radical SAM protein [bacterium]|nr:radical SAM protein [bacterium]